MTGEPKSSRSQEPSDVRRQQQHARYDQDHDRCVVLCAVSAVDNAEALHEDHGKDKVCATLLFECDDHDVQACKKKNWL